jgi:alanyl-tRNA synthetase
MQSDEIRKRFLAFFEKRGHTVLPSASLIPENDPTVLFTTAGMQPLIPYLMGTAHPRGKRLVNVQKCVRTQDIEEVGDNTHDTFFEMLGNWSLGDYFKKDAITWSYEFLTNKDEGLGLDPNRLYVTCFEGDENAPRDEESAEIWKSLGVPENKIYFLSKKSNWWTPGPTGPCGPDTEMFYDVVGNLNLQNKEEFLAADDKQQVIEIWNDVFMEYEQKDGVVVGKLAQKNVDTGAGLERLTMMMQGKNNIFDTDLFANLIEKTKTLSSEQKHQRIIADHLRTAIFMIADGVTPSNTDRGYILRRLIRRAIIKTQARTISPESLTQIIEGVCVKYSSVYQNLAEKKDFIKETILGEQEKFLKTISEGLREFEKKSGDHITGTEAFVLFSTYGFPLELTKELAHERKMTVDEIGFEEESRKHQDTSRQGAEQKFKGGLADTSEQSVKYHTATHLLHKALRDVLGAEVFQKGSNITPERLRFDFSFPRKMTPEEIKQVEDAVNEKIKEAIPVTYEDISKEDAATRGAIGLFEEKYGDIVRVYKIGEYSLEYCGGPHVTNTQQLGTFKIAKEEAVAAGIRRIKAVLS